jgi:iron complex outermembrane receptor protein
MHVYLTYNQALQKGPTAPSTAENANEVLQPYLTQQLELGVKPEGKDIKVQGAVFIISTANAYLDPTTNIYNENGREVHLGTEVHMDGSLNKYVHLEGGFSLLQARVTKSSTPSLLHKIPSGVPQVVAKCLAEIMLPFCPSLSVQAGTSYTGRQYADAPNLLPISSVVTFDAGLRYKFRNYPLVIQSRISNLTGVNYWTTTGQSSLGLGSPRYASWSVILWL